MSLHLVLLVVYSLIVVTLGLWTARYVRTSSAFFVAGRSASAGGKEFDPFGTGGD